MTRDPFRIEGPAIISFSGGRTSGYMLWRILQSHSGTLPDDVKVCFANTGKEMPETLDFVRECGERWSVDIIWLEFRARSGENQFAIVDHATASRNGEPFAALIRDKSMLPNPVMRFCTVELKIRPTEKFCCSLGWDEWTNVMGLRADEPRRVAKRGADTLCPLSIAGLTKADIMAFWNVQPFNLALDMVKGTTPEGNCDHCFLKGTSTIMGIERKHPGSMAWWAEQEDIIGATFRKDRPSYAALLDAIDRQKNMDFGDLDQRIDCMCSEDQA